MGLGCDLQNRSFTQVSVVVRKVYRTVAKASKTNSIPVYIQLGNIDASIILNNSTCATSHVALDLFQIELKCGK